MLAHGGTLYYVAHGGGKQCDSEVKQLKDKMNEKAMRGMLADMEGVERE